MAATGMSAIPGVPHDPTIHQSRTRPEATEFAIKNRTTSDWFRHDASTMKVSQASNAKGQSTMSTGEWLTAPDDKEKQKQHKLRASQQMIHDKIHGREESWFKHDDNRYYVDPAKTNSGSLDARQVTLLLKLFLDFGFTFYLRSHVNSNHAKK